MAINKYTVPSNFKVSFKPKNKHAWKKKPGLTNEKFTNMEKNYKNLNHG